VVGASLRGNDEVITDDCAKVSFGLEWRGTLSAGRGNASLSMLARSMLRTIERWEDVDVFIFLSGWGLDDFSKFSPQPRVGFI